MDLRWKSVFLILYTVIFLAVAATFSEKLAWIFHENEKKYWEDLSQRSGSVKALRYS